MPKKRAEPMTKNVSALLARTQFGQILERVSRNRERFVVTKKGKATAVILGLEDFMESTVQTPESLAALQEQAKTAGMDALSLEEIEREIQAVRRLKTTKASA